MDWLGGAVSQVPHLDEGGGHGEDEVRSLGVAHGDHIVGMTGQRLSLSTLVQVPHLHCPV